MSGLAELEAKLLNSNGERTALLERCISAEREYEGLHERYTELRRHHDNIQAGLHELGRENQTLQVTKSTNISSDLIHDP